MPAVVQRMIAAQPDELPHVEWLVQEHPPIWRRSASGAVFFATHAEADEKADELRRAHEAGAMIFAAIRQRDDEPELPLRGEFSLPAHFNSRQPRRDWREHVPNAGIE